MTEDLNDKNDRLRDTIDQLVESHPELEEAVRDIASKQPKNGTPQQVQANLQERARAIIELQPELEDVFED
jgi:predicted  nucleic acid-binding Zn-ribbon protein